jgi:hypothetical protein
LGEEKEDKTWNKRKKKEVRRERKCGKRKR